MFTLAMQHGRIAYAPRFPRIAEHNARTGFFEPEQLEAVLAELPEHLRPVALFAYLTGWRRGEILGLRWANVDFAHHTVRLEPGSTKNLEGRTFPFGTFPELASLLRERRELTRSLELSTGQVIPWVFASRQGRQISDFYGAWRAACRRAGVPGRIFHDFRRTAVRNLERAGVPRSIAMKLTGHKTEAVYRRYAIVSEADLAEGVAKLARLRLGCFPPCRTREHRAAIGPKQHILRTTPADARAPIASPAVPSPAFVCRR
jgi:integrase